MTHRKVRRSKFLVSNPETRWGRGYLILPQFSWAEVARMLARLLDFTRKESWDDVATELCKELGWEFENYQEFKNR